MYKTKQPWKLKYNLSNNNLSSQGMLTANAVFTTNAIFAAIWMLRANVLLDKRKHLSDIYIY